MCDCCPPGDAVRRLPAGVPFFSLRTQLPRSLCLCMIMMFLTKITLNGFQGKKSNIKAYCLLFLSSLKC